VPPFCAARILDAGLEGNDAYLVSEYVPGRSLLEVVSRDGVLGDSELVPVAIGMATGLASVHNAGLVHGSFGPEYVVMTAAGPRVVEFGITPPYGAATPAADMLAWAQTVVFAAAGRPATAMADLDVLPGQLRDLVADCLSPEPAARPAARAALLHLIGDAELPAGLLAEGSRRAMPGSYAAAAPPAGRAAAPAPRAEALAAPIVAEPEYAPARPASAPPRSASAALRSAAGPARSAAGPVRSGSAQGPQAHAASRHIRAPESAPTPRQPAHHEQSGRGQRIGLIAAGALVALIVIAFGVTKMLGNGKSTGPGKSTPVSLRSPDNHPSPSPRTTPTTPAAFAGSWSGQVQQPPNDTYSVSLKLTKGATTASESYSTAGVSSCSPTLTLTAATSQQLTFSQSAQGVCSAGTVTIALAGNGSIRYDFASGGVTATGTLSGG
jgi:hypothetical protein